TLPQNLTDNFADRGTVNFVLVDFASTDGTVDWIIKNFSRHLESGFLSLYRAPALDPYDTSFAKNTAAVLGSGDILTNLDGDNFTGRRGGRHVLETFASYKGPIVYHQQAGPGDGSTGRISTLRAHFYGVGGYDEQFQPYGYQDHDFVRRVATKYKAKIVPQRISRLLHFWNTLRWRGPFECRFNRCIPNPRPSSIDHQSLDWEEMNAANHLLSVHNVRKGKLVANSGLIGKRELEKYVNGDFVRINSLEEGSQFQTA
ncbi:MAG: glycosyltransferase family 2 protein, partial [Bdellovibrionales bacterium]|nr:glycosyltransferase family 2 protein [Bdellovibrionales bacterium]